MIDDLPRSWLKLKLGDVVDYGRTEKVEPSEISGDPWILELEDIEKGTSKVLQRLTLSKRKSKSTKNKFAKGDLLYGKLRPYLNKVLIATEDGYCSTEIVPIRAPQSVDSRYLFYWLKHPAFLHYVDGVSHGINMPRLGTDAGKNAPFILAPWNEQKRIADKLDILLSRVDACRERLERVPQILKRFRQSVLSAAVNGKLTAEWREEHLLSDVQWRQCKLADILTDIRYGTAQKCTYDNRGKPVLRIPNIGDGCIDLTDLKYAEFSNEDAKRYALRDGDLLVIRSNGSVDLVGKAALVKKEAVDFLFAGYLIRLRLHLEVADPKYILAVLNSPQCRALIELTSRSTSGVNNINSDELKSIAVSLPCLEEQKEIVRRLDAINSRYNEIESHFQAAFLTQERLTSSLLAKAFRGELLAQDSSDEAASDLLSRLQIPENGGTGVLRGSQSLKAVRV
ncbi:MAG: restriction endonuclease subunit S [Candidatus Obscuribacterales bacterium]|nr:restriction endonuclease subunit S [Candidatus Obscuribacterales bacterium]